MDYQVIYDVTKDAFPIATVIFGIVGCLLLFIAAKNIYSMMTNKELILIDVFFVIAIICFAILMMKFSYSSYVNHIGVYVGVHAEQYFRGDYSITEGVTENFYSDRVSERFSVNEVDFDYRKSFVITDYFQDRDNHITGDGQHVRATYVIEGNLVYIVKMEILKEK